MSGDGGQVIIDLSNSAWDNEPGPSFDLAYSAVGARLGAGNNVSAGNVDSPAWSYDDGNEAALAEFARTFDLANETELARLEQDAEPLAARTEDRIEAGTFTPQGQFAREFANSARSGLTDDLGYSIERYPQVGSATPDIVEALRPQLEMIAHRPFLGEDGQVWFDQQFGSPMTLLDHIEAASGIRLGDASLFETGRTRREVAAVQRPQVFGDPDDPDNMPLGIPAGTARTAAALAAQAGIATTASHQEQQAAAVREHDRQAARYRGPRHPDYRADLSNPAPRETGLAAFGDAPWNGSLPVYTRGAA